jgi:hypothetical protein
MAGTTSDDAGRTATRFRPGDRTGADAATRVSSRPTSSRGVRRQRAAPARGRAGYPGPHYLSRCGRSFAGRQPLAVRLAALSTSCSTAWGHSCPARVNGMQQNAAGHAAVAQAARGRRCRDGRGGSMSASCLHRFSRPGVPGQKALAANWVPTLSAMMSWFRCRGQPNGLTDEYPRDIF